MNFSENNDGRDRKSFESRSSIERGVYGSEKIVLEEFFDGNWAKQALEVIFLFFINEEDYGEIF